jgi:lipopolysaccharide transport protein LptA
MALSTNRRLEWLRRAGRVCALVVTIPTVQAADPPAPLSPLGNAPIVVDAASSDANLAKGTGAFTAITVTQGSVKLTADRAQGSYPVDFKNSHWTFEGHVHIDDSARHGSLRADEAVVDFRNGRIEHATVSGKPAEFQQERADNGRLARGHADQIDYDIESGSVRLSKDAWLSDGQNDFSAPLVVYNIITQQVQGASVPGTEQRVHIVVTPQGTSTKTTPVAPPGQP